MFIEQIEETELSRIIHSGAVFLAVDRERTSELLYLSTKQDQFGLKLQKSFHSMTLDVSFYYLTLIIIINSIILSNSGHTSIKAMITFEFVSARSWNIPVHKHFPSSSAYEIFVTHFLFVISSHLLTSVTLSFYVLFQMFELALHIPVAYQISQPV